MFDSENFIDKGNSHKPHNYKASQTTCKSVKIHLKLLKLANSAKLIQLVTNATNFLLITQ